MDRDTLPSLLRDLLISGSYSDFTITCKDRTFNVHRAIVCPQSPFFAAALNGEFLEAQNNSVNLPSDDPVTIARMLSYMYTHDYDEKEDTFTIPDKGQDVANTIEVPDKTESAADEDNNDQAPAPTHENSEEAEDSKGSTDNEDYTIAYNNLGVYLAAEKYGMKSLKELARKRFTAWLKNHDPTETLPELIREIMLLLPPYDRDLRDSIAEYLAGEPDIIWLHGMHSMMEEFGALTTSVLQEVIKDRRALVKDKHSLSQENKFFESKLQVALHENATLKEQFEEAKSTLVSKLDGLSSCRHCGELFNVKLTDYNWGSARYIRCRLCNTRH